jgi:hypothetical protein
VTNAVKRATPATPRELPASTPAVDSRALVGLREPETIRHVTAPAIELARNAKGDYSWTIKSSGATLGEAIEAALSADRHVRDRVAQINGLASPAKEVSANG